MPPSTPPATFLDLLLAAMKSAALEGKITQLQAAFDPMETGLATTHVVRFTVYPDKSIPSSGKEAITQQVLDIHKTGGFQYTNDHVRIIVVPEELTYNWPLHAPLGTPDNTAKN